MIRVLEKPVPTKIHNLLHTESYPPSKWNMRWPPGIARTTWPIRSMFIDWWSACTPTGNSWRVAATSWTTKSVGYSMKFVNIWCKLKFNLHFTGFNISQHHYELNFPSQEDVDGAALALVRLQSTYKLDVAQVAAGILNGVKYGWGSWPK